MKDDGREEEFKYRKPLTIVGYECKEYIYIYVL
jgi:hypothetical protein